jgi:hypothetical protein
MAKKKFDAAAKAKKQKVIAAVGGVILLGVLAFQVPRTMKMLHQSSASAASSDTTPAATTIATTPSVPAGASAIPGTPAATTPDGLSDPGVAVAPQSGQLLTFSRFRSKDPFVQQVNLNCASGSTSTSADCGTTGQTGPTGATGATGGTGVVNPPTPASKPATAVISVNGAGETVSVGAKFPAASPVFVLVSLTRSAAKIGISGGSLQSSKQTVTLKKGATLTLQNTADGTRYVLRLLSVS